MAKFKADAEVVDKQNEDVVNAGEIPQGEEASLVTQSPAPVAKLGEVSGEINKSDYAIPLLQIVQNVGPLSRIPGMKPGDLVLAKEVILAHDSEPWEFVALSVTKHFQERLKYDPNGPRPMRFATEQEVKEANLTLAWINNGPGQKDTPPTAEPVAVITMLVKQPEGNVSPVFSIDIDNANWAMCQWIVQRTLYKVARRLFTARATELAEGGLLSGLWQVVVRDAPGAMSLRRRPWRWRTGPQRRLSRK